MSARLKAPILDMNYSFTHQCSMNADYHSMIFPGEKEHPDTQVSSVLQASTCSPVNRKKMGNFKGEA